MKKLLFIAACIALSGTAFAADKAEKAAAPATSTTTTKAAPAAKTSKDDAVKAVIAKIDEGITKHDAKALSDLFADDATFIAPMGDAKLIKGKAEILKVHEAMMTGPMKDATSKHTVENIRWIGKDAALVDCSVEMTGMHMDMPAGSPMPAMHATALLTMKGGKWMLSDVRPYSIMPMPAPAAPAKM